MPELKCSLKGNKNITKRHLNLKSEEAQGICRTGCRMTYIQPTKHLKSVLWVKNSSDQFMAIVIHHIKAIPSEMHLG